MTRTDGYLTDSPNGNWQYASPGNPIEIPSPNANAWARVERAGGPIPGARVSANGQVSAGPTVQFTTANGLLDGAPASPGPRPFIVWAGVSPLSLREALIVWNDNIVLLNKGAISGAGAISVTGRLMVVDMGGPISINGAEIQNISIGAGAVGYYTEFSGDTCAPSDEIARGGGGGGGLPPPPNFTNPCPCSQTETGDSGDSGGGGGGANLSDALVFCDICNPEAQCGDFEGDKAAFVVNNFLEVPIRCCHPFVLVELHHCNCVCPGDHTPVWLAALEIFHSTVPLDFLPLDKLYDISICTAGKGGVLSNGVPGTLGADANCCETAGVEVVGMAGPQIGISGIWRNRLPGYRGQAVAVDYKCGTACGNSCVSVVTADEAQCWVEEDIIKPIERTIPVSFFDSFVLVTTEIVIPTTTTISVVTTCSTMEITFITDENTTAFEFPTLIETAEVNLITAVLTTSVTIVTELATTSLTYVEDIPEITDLVIFANNPPTGIAFSCSMACVTGIEYVTLTSGTFLQDPVTTTATNIDITTVVHTVLTAVETTVITVPTGEGGLVHDVELTTFTIMSSPGELVTSVDTAVIEYAATPATTTVVIPTGAGAVITEFETAEVNFVTSIGTELITVPTGEGALISDLSYNTAVQSVSPATTAATWLSGVGGLVSEVGTTDITFVDYIETAEITYVEAPFSPFARYVTDIFYTFADVVTELDGESYNIITLPSATPVTVVTSCATTEINEVTGIGTTTLVAATTGHLITAIGTTIIEVCEAGGSVVDVTVITSIGTQAVGLVTHTVVNSLLVQALAVVTSCAMTALPVTNMFLATDVLGDVINYISDLEFEDVVTNDVWVPEVFTLSESVVTAVTTSPGALTSADIVTSVGTVPVGVVSTITTVPAGTLEIVAVTAVGTDSVVLPTVVVTSQLGTLEVTLVTDIATAAVTVITDIGTDIAYATITAVSNVVTEAVGTTAITVPTGGGTIEITAIDTISTEPFTAMTGGTALVTYIQTVENDLTEFAVASEMDPVILYEYHIKQYGDVTRASNTFAVNPSMGPIVLVTDVVSNLQTVPTRIETGSVTITQYSVTSSPVVTAFEDAEVTIAFVPEDPERFEVLGIPEEPPEEGGFTLLTTTTPGCDVPFKFLNHDGNPIQYTGANRVIPDCCDGSPSCAPLFGPVEAPDCSDFFLLRGNYTLKPTGTENACPCWKCEAEFACDPPKGTELEFTLPGGPINPCTARYKRIQRDACKRCF